MTKALAAVVPKKQEQVVVIEVDVKEPGEGQILVKNKSLAFNPVDWKIQKRGVRVPDNEYPVILGWDIAGTVAQVGKNVTRFKVGDRVVAAAASISTPGERFGGFQEYTLVSERGAAKLPQSFSFDDGATLPLAFSTAATGLYKDQGLPLPELETKPGSAGKTALVWGGSSSVGALAVQLLRYSGYTVLATASPANYDYVKKVGATKVFDYHDSDVAQQIRSAAPHKIELVFDAVSENGSTQQAFEVLGDKGVVILVLPAPTSVPNGVKAQTTLAMNLFDDPRTDHLWETFLEPALAQGKIITHPVAVRPGGLNGVQKVFDEHSQGVSGVKLVVNL